MGWMSLSVGYQQSNYFVSSSNPPATNLSKMKDSSPDPHSHAGPTKTKQKQTKEKYD